MANSKREEIYVSVDIEADGPVPGLYSMLSLAAVAYRAEGDPIAEFSANLETLPEAGVHPETARWWEQFPEAWAACREGTREPQVVMPEFAEWVEALPGTAIFVGWPATWDFMWVYWYLIRYTGRRPFSEHGIDMRSYAMGMRRKDFRRAGKHYLPRRWFPEQAHTHVALDDAREQGALFMNMVRENLQGGKGGG